MVGRNSKSGIYEVVEERKSAILEKTFLRLPFETKSIGTKVGEEKASKVVTLVQ